ncbi:MAG: dockerin type I repeat-containing protein [Planctomycetota bacterium]
MRIALHKALALAALAIAHSASAAIVHRVVNLAIPANQYGLWLNVETGASTTTVNGPAGWDFNIYTSGGYTSGPASGGANIVLYTGSSNGSGFMRYPGATSGTPPKLPPQSVIAGYGSFGAGTATFGGYEGAWKLNAENIVGFKFIGADGQLRFGWARVVVGATSTDRVLADYAFESTPNTCIAAGATAGAPPANCSGLPSYDPCASGPLVLAPGDNTMVLNVVNAPDLDLSGKACGGAFVIRRANYFPFDPPASGVYRVSLCANASDTRVAVLAGCTPGAGVLACNDNFCTNAAAVDVALVGGTRVWVAAGAASAATILPTFLPIAIEEPFDPCAAPVAIPTGSTSVAANDSTPELDMTGFCDPGSVHPAKIFKANYARWTAPKTGYFEYGICPSDLQAHVAVMTQCGDPSTVITCAYDQCPATGGARVGFWADGGVEYVLCFGVQEPFYALPTAVTLSIDAAEPPPDPCGEDLLEATLGMQSVRLEFEYPNLPLAGSPCTFAIGDQALRYPKYLRFVPPVSGLYTMGNCSDTDPNFYGIYDLRIAVMTSCGNAQTIVACDDNGCNGDVPPWTSRISGLELAGGVPVYIGLGGNGPAAPGPFAFEIVLDQATGCTGDLNGDSIVNAADLAILLGAWASAGADLNADGTTNAADLAVLLGAWGPCP